MKGLLRCDLCHESQSRSNIFGGHIVFAMDIFKGHAAGQASNHNGHWNPSSADNGLPVRDGRTQRDTLSLLAWWSDSSVFDRIPANGVGDNRACIQCRLASNSHRIDDNIERGVHQKGFEAIYLSSNRRSDWEWQEAGSTGPFSARIDPPDRTDRNEVLAVPIQVEGECHSHCTWRISEGRLDDVQTANQSRTVPRTIRSH